MATPAYREFEFKIPGWPTEEIVAVKAKKPPKELIRRVERLEAAAKKNSDLGAGAKIISDLILKMGIRLEAADRLSDAVEAFGEGLVASWDKVDAANKAYRALVGSDKSRGT